MTKEEFVMAYNIGHRDGKNDEYLPLCYPEFIESMKQEPCEDAISRQAALECLDWKYPDKMPKTKIMELPSVTPQPKTGHWEWVQYDGNPNIGNWHCSECGSIVIECVSKEKKGGIPLYKYCPQCGAKIE